MYLAVHNRSDSLLRLKRISKVVSPGNRQLSAHVHWSYRSSCLASEISTFAIR